MEVEGGSVSGSKLGRGILAEAGGHAVVKDVRVMDNPQSGVRAYGPDPGDAALAPLVLPAGDVAVGCVDLNVGASIPSELLVGRLPADGAGGGRAYLSNVAVADFARRRGVATRLVDAAAEAARGAGVRHLYVHVEARNGAGVALYQGLGFAVESAEAERVARGAGRPARLLLRRALD